MMSSEILTKKCDMCGEIKTIDLFYRNKGTKDGLSGHCKECQKISTLKYRGKNSEKIKQNKKIYNKLNKEKISSYKKEYRSRTETIELERKSRIKYNKNNPEKVKINKRNNYYGHQKEKIEKSREYAINNKEKVAANNSKRYFDNIDVRKVKSRQYRQKNIEKLRKRAREHYENIIKRDPQKLISCRVRSKMYRRITDSNMKHISFIWEKLGYGPEELKSHLEKLFREGMSWDNYGFGIGKWSIDHIVPDSWFKYTSMDDEEFVKSWSLGNLQPMWFIQNASKKNLYSGNYIDKKNMEVI